LVITLLNIHKPRDRSHYERFRHYHETFYRSVEVASVTPFSARALDKGFAGALVSLARHLEPTLTAPQGAEGIAAVRAALERKLLNAFLERVRSQPIHDAAELQERERSVQNRVVDLLDTWQKFVDEFKSVGAAVQYQKWELKQPKPLLMEMLDDQPQYVHTKHGPLVSVPYTIELNDINIMLTSHERSDAMLLRTQDAFERLYAESADSARIMAFGVHPYISGAAHRIRYFEMMLEFLAKQPGVVFWNGSEISQWFQQASPLPAP
jgi:hypothetical protein